VKLTWLTGIASDLLSGIAYDVSGYLARRAGFERSTDIEAERNEAAGRLEDAIEERNALAKHLIGLVDYTEIHWGGDHDFVCTTCACYPCEPDCKVGLAKKELAAMGFAVPDAPESYAVEQSAEADA